MPCSCAHVAIFLTVAACNIVLCAVLARIGKNFGSFAKFDQMAQMEECRSLRHARCLLHIMRNDDDGIFPAQVVNQFLDSGSRDRIKGRARLVHQDHFGINGDGTRNAQTLLLTARQRRAAFA